MNTSTPLSAKLYKHLLEVAQRIAGESDVNILCQEVLSEARKLTRADGGSIYLVTKDDTGKDAFLTFKQVVNRSLDINLSAFGNDQQILPPVPLWNADGSENHSHVAAHAYHKKELINIADTQEEERFDFRGTREFDERNGYFTRALLTVPMVDKHGSVIGMFQLINPVDKISGDFVDFPESWEAPVNILAQFAANALYTHQLHHRQNDLFITFASKKDTDSLLETILVNAKAIANADGGTLYLRSGKDKQEVMEYAYIINDSLGLRVDSQSGKSFKPVPLWREDGTANMENVASYVAHKLKVVNIDDVYHNDEFDFSGTFKVDEENKYRSTSILTIPLLDFHGTPIAVLQLINAKDNKTGEIISFSSKTQSLIESVANYAAIALNNRILIEDTNRLLNSMVHMFAKGIDAKSSHTSGHCENVPLLMDLFVEAAAQDTGKFANFCPSADQRFEIRFASWMHDCGKIATPDALLDKSTKLYRTFDTLETIRPRFAALRQESIRIMQAKIHERPDMQAALENMLSKQMDKLADDLKFIERINLGREMMTSNDNTRLHELSRRSWVDEQGNRKPLLTPEEIELLSIPKGTLSREEKAIINNHINVTIELLESLPFPRHLQNVPEFAGGHHEKMDGSGFPKGLKGDQMSIPAKMMAIADLFEALTANDKPYKQPMKISEVLLELKKRRDVGHIDSDLYQLFIRSGIWQTYAEKALIPEQQDFDQAKKLLGIQ